MKYSQVYLLNLNSIICDLKLYGKWGSGLGYGSFYGRGNTDRHGYGCGNTYDGGGDGYGGGVDDRQLIDR